jgi:signal transduction histidine kinase
MLKLLVVEDNEVDREAVRRLVGNHFQLTEARTAAEGERLCGDTGPDCVLLDYRLPDADGLELLRLILDREVAVIVLTGQGSEDVAVSAMKIGAYDYLVKGRLDRQTLTKAIEHAVERSRLERELREQRREVQSINRELEQRVRTRTEQLEHLNRELEAFSYSVSHDLRAPLRAIDGFAQLLREHLAGSLDAEGGHLFERIQGATRRMAGLIEALLGLAQLQRKQLHWQPLDLSAIARDVVQELRRREPARSVEIAIESGLRASGDPALLAVALENLLGNAWKFTAHRSAPRIEFGRSDEAELPFFVRDNGAGFSAAHAAKLFQPFQRLHSEREFEGTGIGLATVQRIVARHGGRIWAQSEPDGGATFWFTLGEPLPGGSTGSAAPPADSPAH